MPSTIRIDPTIEDVYSRLRNRVDAQCRVLLGRLGAGMVCGPGCSSCCTGISVRRVEYAILAGRLLERRFRPPLGTEGDGRCAFLDGDMCSIYEERPIICRLHGLPLSYPVERFDASGNRMAPEEVSVTWCDLNFSGRDLTDAFDGGDRIEIAPIEDRLAELDRLAFGPPIDGELLRVDLNALARMLAG